MTVKTVIKRNGDKVDFDSWKIINAVNKACEAAEESPMGFFVWHQIEEKNLPSELGVEQIQDLVEDVLMSFNPKVARKYIRYRYDREQLRSIKPIELVDKYLDASDWRVKENASVGYSLGGMILNNSGAVTANYWLNKIYPKEIGDAHRDCKFHIHDLSMLACYCVGHNFLDLIKKGISGVPGKITSKPAKHLSTLFNQLVNYNGLLQNENAGAMAYSSVDTYVAPFIKIDNLSREEVYQCVQSLLFGLNCSSRWGCVPISTKLLTQDGWKQCSEVKIGDIVYTVNPKTRKVEFNSVKKMTRKLNDKEFLIKLYNKEYNYEQIVSYEHRVYTGNGEIHRAYEFLEEGADFTVPLTVDDGFGLTSKFESVERVNIPVEVEKIPYDGEVWCPTTDNGVVFFQDANGREFISANSQAPFSNFTLDWIVPDDLAETYCWIGGEQVDFKYKDCQKEMDMFNEVLLDLFEKGDADGRLFSYPICTYSITKDFDWESSNAKKLFEITCKYGMPYFQNFINSDLSPSDVRSMCCRLRLDKRELMKRGGGLFGAAEKTGSTGVVTINLPQLGYRFKEDKDGFYKELDHLMVMAKESLVIKRKTIEGLLDGRFYPYSKVYVQSYDTFFNTIGINGCNECIRNFTNDKHDISDKWGQSFTNELLDYMNSRLSDFQEETGLLFNLEATPSEGTGYRLALHDKKNFPDIITANDSGDPYYTNSTWLPATYTDDIFEALDIQDQFQTKYTGGTVFHAYLGERIHNWKACAELIKTIFTNYRLPYLTISPTFSVCPVHGYLDGEQEYCPRCKDEKLHEIDKKIEKLQKELEVEDEQE